VTQELGILALIGRNVRVLTANGDDLTNTDDHFKVAMRQIAGAFVQLEKARLVAKLKAARERKKAQTGKCGGRRRVAELSPETVALARKLARYPVNRRKRSLRDISSELAKAGHTTRNGTSYTATAVAKMIARDRGV
jgi:DNA invertase Pin-like site-specific DNA recombinase